MTIDELRTLEAHGDPDDLAETMSSLAPEILALVEAAEDARRADTTRRGIELIIGDALDAFNAKLEAL